MFSEVMKCHRIFIIIEAQTTFFAAQTSTKVLTPILLDVKKTRGPTSLGFYVGVFILPVGVVVDPAHLFAGLQQVQDPCRTSTLLLHLRVATLDLRLGLRVYVQGLFV